MTGEPLRQVQMSMNEIEVPADAVDGERLEVIRLGGPRDGDRIGYATVPRLPDEALYLDVEPEGVAPA